MKVSEQEPTTVIKDSITAGILKAFGIDISPQRENDRVIYQAKGDVQGTLKKIYSNQPIGSRDVLESIKATRSMIWVLREGQR